MRPTRLQMFAYLTLDMILLQGGDDHLRSEFFPACILQLPFCSDQLLVDLVSLLWTPSYLPEPFLKRSR
jgi:hypothetical protein